MAGDMQEANGRGQDAAYDTLLSRFEELQLAMRQGQADTAQAQVARVNVAGTHVDEHTSVVSAGGHHKCRFESFRKLPREPVWSDSFEAGIGTWRLLVYQKGSGAPTHLAVYLELLELQGCMWVPMCAEFTVTLVNQLDARKSDSQDFPVHQIVHDVVWWRLSCFVELPALTDKPSLKDAGFLINDTLHITVDVAVEHENRFQLDTGVSFCQVVHITVDDTVEHGDRFQLDTGVSFCQGGVPCDATLELQCGVKMPTVSQFLQASSPFFRGFLEDAKGSDPILGDGSLGAWIYILSDLYPQYEPHALTLGSVYTLIPVVHKCGFTKLLT
ncbi:hypothetical protein FOA52_007721 [Chlamydomonas sp. UWO 241]|nr:hypothetical protein FOA52_007721 [Chlamydomonas sp. UWO 241]